MLFPFRSLVASANSVEVPLCRRFFLLLYQSSKALLLPYRSTLIAITSSCYRALFSEQRAACFCSKLSLILKLLKYKHDLFETQIASTKSICQVEVRLPALLLQHFQNLLLFKVRTNLTTIILRAISFGRSAD